MPGLICLFGGTFDPVHYGHLRPLAELQARVGCDEIRILPAAVPPHRPPPIASAAQRLDMLRLALEEFPGFVLDARELDRPGLSYTVDTLQDLRRETGDDRLCLVMGGDAFAGLPTWHHWRELFELCHIIVIERPGAATAGEQAWARERLVDDPAQLRARLSGCVLPVRLALVDISATDIRHRLAEGLDVRGVLPDAVLAYIQRYGLYR